MARLTHAGARRAWPARPGTSVPVPLASLVLVQDCLARGWRARIQGAVRRVCAFEMAVASVVPAKWWRWRLALALASSFPVSLSPIGALGVAAASASTNDQARATSSGVTLAVSDTYGVNVPAGSWVPVAVSVVNHRVTDLEGQVVVSVPVAQMNNGGACAASGVGFVCGATFAPPAGYASAAQLPEVTYRIPLSLAPGISKQFVAYVLAESPYGNVQALIRAHSGTVLAKASAPLPVAYGTPNRLC